MDIALKITGLCCLTVMFCVALLLNHDDPQIWGTILGLFSLLVGGGQVILNALKGVTRKDGD